MACLAVVSLLEHRNVPAQLADAAQGNVSAAVL